jgi:hypothetical protein
MIVPQWSGAGHLDVMMGMHPGPILQRYNKITCVNLHIYLILLFGELCFFLLSAKVVWILRVHCDQDEEGLILFGQLFSCCSIVFRIPQPRADFHHHTLPWCNQPCKINNDSTSTRQHSAGYVASKKDWKLTCLMHVWVQGALTAVSAT